MLKDTVKFYSDIYNPLFKKNYTKSTHRGGASLDVFEKFAENNKVKIKSMIDVGCAWAKTLKYWSKKNVKCVGIDVAKVAVNFCAKKGFKSYHLSATDLSKFKDKQFDLYMASDVFEHLRTDDLHFAIEEAKRITSQYLLIRPHPVMDKRGLSDKSKALHLTVWSLEEWESFFIEHDLEIIKVGEDGATTYKNVFLMRVK